MTKTIAILATLDTKGHEASFLRQEIEAFGGKALLIDIGVVGDPTTEPDVRREKVMEAGGTPLADMLAAPTRQDASPVIVAGAKKIVLSLLNDGKIDGILGLGGTQGTPNCTVATVKSCYRPTASSIDLATTMRSSS